jgi:HSP20 family protein
MTEKKERSIARSDPFGELADWRPFFGPLFGREGRGVLEELWGRGSARGFAPSVDVSEDDAHFIVTAELPGIKREDVNVELEDDVLTIRGEKRRSEREEKKEKRRFVERSYGTFSRSFTLPANADPERIGAGFKDGVLTVTIGKRPETKPRVVDIKAS